jgi:hypothetical protein
MLPLIAIAGALAQFAPVIAGMLGGPKAEEVAKVAVNVAQSITGAPDGPKALEVLKANPEMALLYEQAMAAKQVELARIAADDRKDERAVDVAVLQNDTKDRDSARAMVVKTESMAPAVISAVVVLGFLGVLTGMLYGTFSAAENNVLMLLLGSLSSGFVQVLNFWLGSSEGSKRKTEVMSRQK